MHIPILFALVRLLYSFGKVMRRIWHDERSRGLVYSVGILLLLGTLFYRVVEGWGWVDALYFTVITLTTVGYGDFSPATTLGKLFTIVYLLLGLGLLASFISIIAMHYQDMSSVISTDDNQADTTSSGS